MKIYHYCFLAAIISISIFSCSKTTVTPTNTNTGTHTDTSTTLIGNISLVGKWNVITDTVSYAGSRTMYHGVSTDHYIFTKYGNLFISLAPNNFTDTAVYAINTLGYSVAWQNNSSSVNGTLSRVQSISVPYTITTLNADSLILTSSAQTDIGVRYEQIFFKKQ